MSERRSGYRSSFGGLIGAILMALLLIVFVWGLTRFQHRDVADPAPAIDYSDELAAARAEAPFPVLAPTSLPDGWKATSANWDGVEPELSWHLGFVTGDSDDATYVGLEQGNAALSDFLLANTPADQPGPALQIQGETWETLTSPDGKETALVATSDEVTTLVTGTATEDELVDFIARLSDR